MVRIFVFVLLSHLVCSQICFNYFLDDRHFIHKIFLSFLETNESNLHCKEKTRLPFWLLHKMSKRNHALKLGALGYSLDMCGLVNRKGVRRCILKYMYRWNMHITLWWITLFVIRKSMVAPLIILKMVCSSKRYKISCSL
jgi:hypothetical protein